MCQRLEAQPDSPPVPVLRSSVGAGCDGFLQLQVQGSWAELEAAVAGLTDAAGLEQLLAWHWDLLVTTAGTEHVTAVPAVMLPGGEPELALTAITLGCQMVWVPASHLSVLLVHLLPAGLREELCAAARQTVGVQVLLRVCH